MFFSTPKALVLAVFLSACSICPEIGYSQGFMAKLNSFNLLLKYRNTSSKPVLGVTAVVETAGAEDKIYPAVNDSNQGVQFVFDKKYTITVYKDKYFPLKIIVDTDFKEKKGKIKFNKDQNGLVKLNYDLDLTIPICLLSGSMPADTSQKPQARIYFDPVKNAFVLDSTYAINGRESSVNKMCSILLRKPTDKVKYVDYNAKLVYGKKKSLLIDQGLSLKDSKGDIIQSTKTDLYGDFSFKKINAMGDFNVVLEKNSRLPYGEQIFISDQKGEVTREIPRDKDNDFAFDLLSDELMQLTASSPEENVDKLKKFKTGKETELTITENILYAPGEWQVSAANSKILMELVQTLQQNTNYKIEIYSYTDAVGDAQANMDLSNRRAKAIVDLFISKGIKAERLKWKGFGETKMINKCVDGVECTEKERQANRRTEFKLIKDAK